MEIGTSKLGDSGRSTAKQERVGNRPRRTLLERQDRKTSGYLDDTGTSVDNKAAMKSGSDNRANSTRNGHFNVESRVSEEPCDERIPPMDDSKAQNDNEGKPDTSSLHYLNYLNLDIFLSKHQLQAAERHGYMRNLWGNVLRCTPSGQQPRLNHRCNSTPVADMSSALEPGENPTAACNYRQHAGRLATDKPMGKVARKGCFNPKTSSSTTSPTTTPTSSRQASPTSKKSTEELDVADWLCVKRKCTGLGNIYHRWETPECQVVKACVPPIPTPATDTVDNEAAMEMAKKQELLHYDPPMADSKHVETGDIPDERSSTTSLTSTHTSVPQTSQTEWSDIAEWFAAKKKCAGLDNIHHRLDIEKTPEYQVAFPTPATEPGESGSIPDERKIDDCVEKKTEDAAGLVKSTPEEFDIEERSTAPDRTDRVESSPDEACLLEKSSSESGCVSQSIPNESSIVESSSGETSGPVIKRKLDEYDAIIDDQAWLIRAKVSAEDSQLEIQSATEQTLLAVLDCVENSQVDVKPDNVKPTLDELVDSDIGTSDVTYNDTIAMAPSPETEDPETVKTNTSDLTIPSTISDISKYTNSDFAVLSLTDLGDNNYSNESSKADDDTSSRKLSDVLIDTPTDIDPDEGFDNSSKQKLIVESTEKVNMWLEKGGMKRSKKEKKEKKKLDKQKNGDKTKRKWWHILFCYTKPMED